MRTGNKLWRAFAVAAFLGTSAIASASNGTPSPTAITTDGQTLTWSQVGVGSSGSPVQEFELFDGDRNLGWARIIRDQPSNERNGAICPSITVNWSVTAGSQGVQFIIGSALLAFPEIANAQVRLFGSAKVIDNDFSGAQLAGLGVGGAIYEGAVNGAVGFGGTTVANGLLSPIFADDGEMTSEMFDTGCLAAGDISSMQVKVSFSLSPMDSAMGSVRFEVCCGHPIPLPTGGAMGLAGLMSLGAIRRRRA